MFYKAIKGKSFIVFNADVLLIFSPLGGTVSLQVKKCRFFSHKAHSSESDRKQHVHVLELQRKIQIKH